MSVEVKYVANNLTSSLEIMWKILTKTAKRQRRSKLSFKIPPELGSKGLFTPICLTKSVKLWIFLSYFCQEAFIGKDSYRIGQIQYGNWRVLFPEQLYSLFPMIKCWYRLFEVYKRRIVLPLYCSVSLAPPMSRPLRARLEGNNFVLFTLWSTLGENTRCLWCNVHGGTTIT